MSAPELNRKIEISIGVIIMMLSASFSLGGIFISLNGLNDKMDREITLLRDEVLKEDIYIRKEIEAVKKAGETRQKWINDRTDRKVKNHEAIYHNER